MTTTQPTNQKVLDNYRNNGEILPIGYIFKNNSKDPLNSIEITGKIDQGGFAVTYEGKESYFINGLKKERTIAIKEFYPLKYCERDKDGLCIKGTTCEFEKFLKKFKDEARILNYDNGDHIMKANGEGFQENGTFYYTMNYIDGGSLYKYVKEHEKFSDFKDVWNFLKPLCEGLGKIHQNKIIHCDISPNNILIDNKNKPILIDFGSCLAIPTNSKNAGFSQTMTMQKLYSPLEIADRQQYEKYFTTCNGITVSADIYSLGLIMYFMMEPNFFDEYNKTYDLPLCRKIHEEGFKFLKFPKDMDSRAREVIEKACEPNIENRPQNMEKFIEFCDNAIRTENVKSIANNTDINISQKIKINELASKGTLTITLPIDDTSLNSNIIEGYSWRAFLKDNNLDPDSPDFIVGNLKFKRISINAEKIDLSENYKLFAQ